MGGFQRETGFLNRIIHTRGRDINFAVVLAKHSDSEPAYGHLDRCDILLLVSRPIGILLARGESRYGFLIVDTH
jgi:hypothetical protein